MLVFSSGTSLFSDYAVLYFSLLDHTCDHSRYFELPSNFLLNLLLIFLFSLTLIVVVYYVTRRNRRNQNTAAVAPIREENGHPTSSMMVTGLCGSFRR